MSACLHLALVIFIVVSSCGGFPTEKPDGALQADDLPKDEYSDVIRLLNSSAHADSGERAKHDHAANVSPHGAHRDPLAPTVSKTAKKLSKSSPVKKYKTRKYKSKHSPKQVKKIVVDDTILLNDSPAEERVREVLSRRRISSKLASKVVQKAEDVVEPEPLPLPLPQTLSQPIPQPYPQPSYQPYSPYNYQPNFFNNHQYQSPYQYYNDYSFPPVNSYIAPQYPYFPDNNNWDNNVQINQIPSEPVIKIPQIEPPELHWTAEIEYPNMPPIVITDLNYTGNPHTEVNILPESVAPVLKPAKPAWTAPTIKRPRSALNFPYGGPPPIIWSHGIPYAPLHAHRQPQFLPPSPQYNPMMSSYGSIASPYNFVIPPVYYLPPSHLPYTQNTPVQTWLPSSQPNYPTWHEAPQHHQNSNLDHHVNVYPAKDDEDQIDSVEEGSVHATVFQGSKEVTGSNLEVNVFPADKNAPDVDESAEMKSAVVPADSNEDDYDSP